MRRRPTEPFHFDGFDQPNSKTTPTPDVVFDFFLSQLSGAELKLLLYIIRRTMGFNKDADAISLRQMTSGIVTRAGRILDRGTGLDRTTAIKSARALVERGIITISRVKSERGENSINVYGLRFKLKAGSRGVEKSNYASVEEPLEVVGNHDPQETVNKGTVRQDSNHSKYEKCEKRGEARQMIESRQDAPLGAEGRIAAYVTSLTRYDLLDFEHERSNSTQAINLWHKSRMSEAKFMETMQEARGITERAAGRIQKRTGYMGLKNRAPYFFSVLRNLILRSGRLNFIGKFRLGDRESKA